MLAAIFVASIEELTGEDYSEAQQQAWASAADDEEQFGKRLASELTLIATLQNSPVGFASLKGADHIDMLYVHPSCGRTGRGGRCCARRWKSSPAAAAPRALTVDASDNAEPFFLKRGYVGKQRNTVTVNGEWLANTTMQKTLAARPLRREARHEPRTPLSVRHHAARRRADQRRRFHPARQATDRADAGRTRHRLCRGRLSRRQSHRHRILCRPGRSSITPASRRSA